jgi:hypothetical protein
MITDFSQTTLDSGVLAMLMGEMAFLKTSQEGYEMLRTDAQDLVKDSEELASISFPATVVEMREKEMDLVTAVMEKLSQLRSRVGGDVLPLTLFMMTHCVCRGVVFAAFEEREDWDAYRGLLVSCLSDVGIDGEEVARRFEQRAVEIVVKKGKKRTLADSDRRELVQATIEKLWDEIYDRWSKPIAMDGQLAALSAQLTELRAFTGDFRTESHEEHREILESIEQLRGQLVDRLKSQGLPPAQVEELADIESPAFLERVRRWMGSAKARDAAEAALWAALDFVPAGATVKLGIKLASAVRRATK